MKNHLKRNYDKSISSVTILTSMDWTASGMIWVLMTAVDPLLYLYMPCLQNIIMNSFTYISMKV